jgi:hypothetical protein
MAQSADKWRSMALALGVGFAPRRKPMREPRMGVKSYRSKPIPGPAQRIFPLAIIKCSRATGCIPWRKRLRLRFESRPGNRTAPVAAGPANPFFILAVDQQP